MSNTPRYVGFLEPNYNVTLSADSGSPLNLAGCTANSFTLTLLNVTNGTSKQGVGVWSTPADATGTASYAYAAADLNTPGVWAHYTTVKLPAETSPREFDPDPIVVLPGTVGAGAAPPGVLPAPIAAPLYVNVRDYAAQGDGVSNDTTPINNALTAFASLIASNGNAALIFPSGTYMHDGLLIQNLSNFQILGPGHLKLNRSRTGNATVNTNDVLTLVNCTDFVIDGLEVDGNRHSDVAWPTTDHAPVTQYLQVNAASGQANVTISDGTKFVVGERVWVCGGLTANGGTEHDFVDNNSQNGIAIDAINGNVLTLHQTLANAYTSTGVAGGAYVTTYQTGVGIIAGPYTLHNEDSQNGIHLLGCTRFTITKCYCHDTWESPIKCGIGFDTSANVLSAGCTYGLIANNRCWRGYDQGVSVWVSQFIRVIGNYCEDTGWAGCSLSHSDDCIVSNNTLHGTYYRIPLDNGSGYGVAIEGGARNVISDNLSSAHYNAGVQLRHSPLTFGVSGVTLNGNLGVGSTSIPVSSGANFVIGAIYTINDAGQSESIKVTNVVVNTLTVAEKTRYFHATGLSVGIRCAEDNRIEGNSCTESVSANGILVNAAVRTQISNNIIARNFAKGILVSQSNGFTPGGTIIDGNHFTGNGQGTASQGILVDTVDDVQILNNRIDNSFGDKGIHLKSCRRFKIVGNSISRIANAVGGIQLENNGSVICSQGVIANNNIMQCDGSAIKTLRANHITISGNMLWANAGSGGLDLGGIVHCTIKGNTCIANATNGIILSDNNAVPCTWNIIEGNVVRDDGTGIKGSDGTALTQGVSITLTGTENNNTILNNQVDHATAKVGASTTITGDIIN